MIWQDLVIALANIGFIIGLVEQIYEIRKSSFSSLSLISCSIYAIGLYSMSVAMISLGLIFSATVTAINGILWTTLLFLSYKYRFIKT